MYVSLTLAFAIVKTIVFLILNWLPKKYFKGIKSNDSFNSTHYSPT